MPERIGQSPTLVSQRVLPSRLLTLLCSPRLGISTPCWLKRMSKRRAAFARSMSQTKTWKTSTT
ncbi:hypothetical protein JG687_00017194 [Phytophthora cactorum]|uniref:Uncharacterized protein n=1 Tax=Phytophthora cactorum TaxID=29920 RepID=A0A8T1TS47_9STRA|nr:hypothetical protein JG687_00017194 [Phytophthora cactorum]